MSASIGRHRRLVVHAISRQETNHGKEPKKLSDLFHDTLKDICFADKKILATLPSMATAAQSPDLTRHSRNTEVRLRAMPSRLEKIFASIDKKPQAKTCDATVGTLTQRGPRS